MTREKALLDKGIYWLDSGGTLHVTPHPGQYRALTSPKMIIIMSAGTQGGKTSLLPLWLYNEIVRLGPGDYIAATATAKLFQKKFLPEMLSFFEGVMQIGRYWAGAGIIELKDPETGRYWAKKAHDAMWGRILITSAQSPGGLESATANAAILDEVGHDFWKLFHWEGVQRRLSIARGRTTKDGVPAGRILAGTTLYNLGWLYHDVYLRWTQGDPDIDWIEFSSVMNPAFPEEEYERQKRNMDEWKFAMFYEGKFAKPPGLVYSAFNEKHHVEEPFVPTWRTPVVLGVDFGGANTAVVWLAKEVTSTGKTVWHVFDESLDGGESIQGHVRKNREKMRDYGLQFVKAWGGAPGESEQRRTWTEAGLQIMQPPTKDVETGIAAVVKYLRNDKLMIGRNCSRLLHEFSTYSYQILEDGTVTDKIARKNTFHMLDALRYAIAGIEGMRNVEIFR